MKSSDRSSLLRTFIILSFQIFIESLSIPSGTAQVIPDSSLGNEKSRVNAIDGVSDRIDGGARRGGNLFHSFQEFNVNAGKKVYFANPEGVMNILSRVTGGNASQIMGKLGVLGQSNLFLINPNGIIFGPGSSLDVRGSFVGTTARGVIFADGTEFSATNPQSNPLLTISVPLGLQMGNQPAPIKVESTILTVKLGQTLALVGGDLTLDGARLNAPGGGIVFGSLSGNGLTGLNFVDNIPTFSFPAGVARGDVLINNGSKVDVQGWDGGSIAIDGGNINITGISEIRAGIFGGPTSGEAGNIDIKATGTLNLEQQSQISNTLNLWAVGKAGDINITAENLSVKDGAQIGTLTQGVGDAGNINLIVGGTISFDGMDANWFQSGALSQVQPGAQGNGGTVKLTARSISFSNFGGVSVSSSGEGNAGNVILNGGDEIVLDGGYVLAGVASGGNGKGGDINVNTPFLTLVNGAQLVSTIFEDASGTAGNINIIANSISLSGVADGYQTAIFSNVYGTGNGGNINLTTGKLSITDQAQLVTTNVGQGNAGNLNVQAKESVLIDGFNTGVYTSIGPGVQGNAGGIVIDTKVINIGNGSQINATTEGKGNGGTIAITATEAINLTNGGEIISKVVREATGNAGDITLSTNSLSLTYYAKIEASTAGVGDAGLIKITADNITLDTYSNLKTIVEHYTTGNSRGIEINTNSLTVTGGANLLTSSYDKGDAGDIKIIARDKITLSGLGQPSDAYKTIDSTILADAEGNSGAIDITAGSLQLTDGAQISASTSGAGDTGKVKITATGGITLSNSKVESVVNTGAAGNSEGIEITTGSLSLTGGSIINATTEGRGNAGDISINAAGAISVSSEDNDGFISGIISQVAPGAKGNSEGIEIVTGSLSLEGGARISASTFGKGDAGAISITAADRISVSGEYRGGSRSGIYSQVETTAQGNSGGIGINTGSLSLEDGAIIDATTSGRGNAGAISITAARSISLLGEDSTGLGSSIAGQVASGAEGNSIGISITSNSLFLADKAQISTTTFGGGTAGNISITANTLSSSDGSRIKTDTETAFDAGNLTLNISDTLTLSDSRLIAETTGAGKAGNIIINAPRFDIADGALVSAKTSAPGNGGSITINAPQSLSLGENSQLTVETGDAGRAGNIDITSDTVTIGKNAEISATATATATNTEGGGSITLNAANLALSGKLGIFAETAGSAPAGSLTINANGGQPDLNIQFTDTAVISARTSNRGTGGSINISSPRSIDIAGQGEITVETTGSGGAGNINITTGQLSIGNGTRISASTAGTGSAGSINLDAREGITIADPGSGLYARTSSGGDAGNIVVTTPQFNLDSSAIIQASTSGSGKGGNITINAPLSLILGDRSQLDVESSNAGKAGNIDITSNTVTIGKDARISATATPTATAGGGNIALNASNLNIAGQLGIFAETGGEAPAGTLILNPDNGNPGLNIRFIEQGKISASTSASGKGGDINISAPDVIDVRGNGSIATATSGSGDAGTIGFSTDELILANGVTVTASTTGSGKAGNIHLNATGVNLQKATVTAFTDGVGNAGSITVPNANSITLDDSTISTEIKENGRANQASNITLTSGTLNLRNNSEINASTSGEGNAGEITLTNQQLQLENSKITAFSSGVGDAGSISLPETENLTLMNGSEISVSTGEKGNAGSITVPLGQNISLDNSKITASTSGQGNTGIINLRGTRKIQLVNNSEISNAVDEKGVGNAREINLDTAELSLENSEITSSTSGMGNAGSITVPDATSITLDNSTISTEIKEKGRANQPSNITLTSRTLNLRNQSEITASTSGEGNAGEIGLTNQQLQLENSKIKAFSSGVGDAGSISLPETENLTLMNGSEISVSTGEKGNAGSITVPVGQNISLDNSKITASTSGQGNTGIINLRGTQKIQLVNNSEISNAVDEKGVGNAREINLDTAELSLENSEITSSTSGVGNAGSITVPDATSITLDNSTISTEIKEKGRANQPSNITLTSRTLNLRNQSAINASTSGEGNAGEIGLTNQQLQLENSKITAFSSGVGDAGSISLPETENLTLMNGSEISVSTGEKGNAGSITVPLGQNISLDNSKITASTSGQGNTGIINLRGTRKIQLVNNSEISNAVDEKGVGNAREINLDTAELSLENSEITSSTSGMGNAGSITVPDATSITLDNSTISTEIKEKGRANQPSNITLTSRTLNLRNQSEITASTSGEGNAGEIGLTNQQLQLENSKITAFSSGVGDAGSISLPETENLTLMNGSEISVSTGEKGNAGSITVPVGQNISLDNSKITASTSGQGNTGIINLRGTRKIQLVNNSEISNAVDEKGVGNAREINLDTAELSLENSEITSSTSGVGNAGSITVPDATSITLDNSTISTEIKEKGRANQPSNITLTSRTLNLRNQSEITASTSGEGNAGEIGLTNQQLQLENSKITAFSSGVGDAGSISLPETENLTLMNGSEISVSTGEKGNAGSITVPLGQNISLDNSKITASTSGQGNTGIINLRGTRKIQLVNNSEISNAVDEKGVGNAREINLDTAELSLENSEITSSTSGLGNAGSITVPDATSITLDNSTISTEIKEKGRANQPSNITLTSRTLNLRNQSEITASTSGEGNAGEIGLTNQQLQLENSKITAFSSGVGDAGSISLPETENLTLMNGSEISVSTGEKGNAGSITVPLGQNISLDNSKITASTSGQGNTGIINLRGTRKIQLVNNSEISNAVDEKGVGNAREITLHTPELSLENSNITSSTSGMGNAGSITVPDATSITLDNSKISTEIGAGGTANQPSNITLQTGELRLNDSNITASSQGTGNAGNINLQIENTLRANNGNISTAAVRTSGGGINIAAGNVLLENNSNIRTNVAIGTGGGGQITLTADSILAFNDSNILAFAQDGAGGNINLNTPIFFGNGFSPGDKNQNPENLNNNNRVDVNAKGAISGVINLPDLTFIQNSLLELPETVIDTQNLLANSCVVPNRQKAGTFIMTGPDGLQVRPSRNLSSPYPTGTIKNLPTASQPPKINEAQGFYLLSNGRTVLSRKCF